MIIRMFNAAEAPFTEVHISEALLPWKDGVRLAQAWAQRWSSRCEVEPDRPPARAADAVGP